MAVSLSGLFLQFINPKIYIYCIMSMEAYILPFYTVSILCLDSRCSLRLSALSLRYVGLPWLLRSSGCFPNMQS